MLASPMPRQALLLPIDRASRASIRQLLRLAAQRYLTPCLLSCISIVSSDKLRLIRFDEAMVNAIRTGEQSQREGCM